MISQLWLFLVSVATQYILISGSRLRHSSYTCGQHAGFLNLPQNITKIAINVGSNVDPILPDETDESMAVIAIEPILTTALNIPKHPRLYVVTAALSDKVGFGVMNVFNGNGMSSSLNRPVDSTRDWVWKPDGYNVVDIVPVLTLQMLLAAVPEHIEILLLKTDMQGNDFSALKSAKSNLRRVKKVQSECWCGGFAHYAGVMNDYHKDFEPYMKGLGFSVTEDPCPPGSFREVDAVWIRSE